jgi:hypothetical protein
MTRSALGRLWDDLPPLLRNAVLVLVLANALYFMWAHWSPEKREPGVAVLTEEELGPPLSMAERPAGDDTVDGTVAGEGEPSELVAVVGRSCVSVGPFRDRPEAETAAARYAGEGMGAAVRPAVGEVFVGHWVQIRGVADAAASEAMIATLHEGGLTDAYPIETEDEGRKISLGVFGNIERAQSVEAEAEALGLDAETTPRTTEGPVYWADLALPPGRGAAEIVAEYGEERVLLRNQATCPP